MKNTTAVSEAAKSFLQSAIASVAARRPFDFPPAGAPPRSVQQRLTPRQREVLELLCEGLTNKAISRRLGIGNATTKIHVSCILRALNVTSRLQAAIAARRLGLIDDQAPAKATGTARQPMVLRVVWDGATAQIIGVDAETVA